MFSCDSSPVASHVNSSGAGAFVNSRFYAAKLFQSILELVDSGNPRRYALPHTLREVGGLLLLGIQVEGRCF